jgi:hypothetical protein
MPSKLSAFQAMLGAIGTVAFVISNTLNSSGGSRSKRITGTIEKIDPDTVALLAGSRRLILRVASSAPIHLNAKAITFEQIENGRQAAVRYEKRRGELLVTEIDVFPTQGDIEVIAGPSATQAD